MSAEKLVKETKWTIGVSLFVSLALFVTWVILQTTAASFTDNKAFLALSLIPFSAALASFLKLTKIKKNPKMIVSETDERLVAEKNEADAKTLKVLQGILFLSYLGYTFIIPEDTFSSIGWWITLGVLLFSLFAPFIFRHMMKEA
ncbi:hypothetical protein LC065_18135 [Halobacillus litoralis]|uniref:hypothetical protein n=1 Tax=Halobacillus litoralis TaxID=45668 RepID=UPI00273DC4F0|nr:hypothetical protein [Halobacillus litoralis]WLR47411.1 hypothetical protein LC065_18135 [Halobacillus litoralis]